MLGKRVALRSGSRNTRPLRSPPDDLVVASVVATETVRWRPPGRYSARKPSKSAVRVPGASDGVDQDDSGTLAWSLATRLTFHRSSETRRSSGEAQRRASSSTLCNPERRSSRPTGYSAIGNRTTPASVSSVGPGTFVIVDSMPNLPSCGQPVGRCPRSGRAVGVLGLPPRSAQRGRPTRHRLPVPAASGRRGVYPGGWSRR